MTQKHVIKKLREILNKNDTGNDNLINRKTTDKHDGEIDVLLENVSLLVKYLEFEVVSTRRELFQVRIALEEDN